MLVSVTHSRSTTDALKIDIFTRAMVVRQQTLLVRGVRCTNARHIFVRSARSWAYLKFSTHGSASMYTPENRQKPAGRVRKTSYQHQMLLLCITWLSVEGAGQWRATSLPCAASALKAGTGYTRAARPALEQQAVTVLFLQINP